MYPVVVLGFFLLVRLFDLYKFVPQFNAVFCACCLSVDSLRETGMVCGRFMRCEFK